MSQFIIRPPLVHIPSFKEYKISGKDLAARYSKLNINQPFPRSDEWYYHSDPEGWAKLVKYLVFSGKLYRKDRTDCDWYARKAFVTCCELFGLNTMLYTTGIMPLGPHGFNTFWIGDTIMILEPNESFKDRRGEIHDLWGYLDGDIIFELGDNGYIAQNVLL